MYAKGEVMTFKKQDVGWTIRRFVVKWCPQQIDSPTGNHRRRKMFVFLFFSSLDCCETRLSQSSVV